MNKDEEVIKRDSVHTLFISFYCICFHFFFAFFFLDEDDSAELDAIISELRDFKIQFEECSNPPSSSSSIKKINKMDQLTNHPSSSITSSSSPSSSSNTNGCVYELRTLEDQLEAALASLTLTINDCTTTNIDSQQQRSSGSSACSSGLGDEITSDSLNLYNNISNTNHQTTTTTTIVSFSSKIPTVNITDDCDSAFSDSGSTDKVTSPNHDESVRIIFSFIRFIIF
jgi:hypothetical protein